MGPEGTRISDPKIRRSTHSALVWWVIVVLAVAPSAHACGPPTVATTAVSSITSTTATSGGNATHTYYTVTARGVCWNTTGSPTTTGSKTVDGSGLGAFTSNLTGLTPGTTYYLRAYATDSCTTAYGSQVSFTTSAVVPTVTTAGVTNVTTTTAASGGNVTNSGGVSVTAHGVCWNTTGNPTIANSKTTDGTGTGSFASSLAGLTPATTYHVRAYATNSVGTAYGSEEVFTTLAIHTVTFDASGHGALTGILSQTVAHAGDCTAVTAVPDVGYHFGGWTGDYIGNDNPLTVTNVTDAMTITAHFAIDTHTVTFAVGGHGALQGTAAQTVDYGADCTAVTAVPDGGYYFTGWSGDCVGHDNPLAVTNVTDDLFITANFAIDSYTVTFAAGGHGALQGATAQTVNHGAACTAVTPIADAGYHFSGWTGDYVGNDDPLTVTNVTADMTITAHFAVDEYTVLFSAGAGGTLTGTLRQTVTLGGSCTAVTATADDGYSFVDWTGAGGFNSTDDSLTVTNVSTDLVITANFAPHHAVDEHTVTFSAGIGGTLTGELSQTVTFGGSCTAVMAVPDGGYDFSGWTGDYVGHNNPLILTNVTNNLAITASFAVQRTPSPDLRLVVETAPQEIAGGAINVGDELRFVIRVENLGDGEATDVQITIPLPENTEFVSAEVLAEDTAQTPPPNVAVVGNQVVLAVEPLPRGGHFMVELVLWAKARGQVVITPVVRSAELAQGVSVDQSAAVEVQDDPQVALQMRKPAGVCGALGLSAGFVLPGLWLLRRRAAVGQS